MVAGNDGVVLLCVAISCGICMRDWNAALGGRHVTKQVCCSARDNLPSPGARENSCVLHDGLGAWCRRLEEMELTNATFEPCGDCTRAARSKRPNTRSDDFQTTGHASRCPTVQYTPSLIDGSPE